MLINRDLLPKQIRTGYALIVGSSQQRGLSAMALNDVLVMVLEEAGYNHAIFGMSLSYYDHAYDLYDWWNDERKAKAAICARKLAHLGGGHNKFLESMQVWLYIRAPLYFWSEFDTYRVGVTKNSSSTMHTLANRPLSQIDFVPGTRPEVWRTFNIVAGNESTDIGTLKANLPSGYLQERQVCINYMALQNIIRQRKGHRLREWAVFIDSVLAGVSHPEFLQQ